MKRKSIYALAVVAALLVFASIAAAGYGAYGKPGSPRGYCPQMSGYWGSELNLTESQQQRMREMNETFSQENNHLRETLYSRHQELRQLWAQPDPDKNLILQKQDEIHEIRAALRDNITHHRMQMRNELLTSEQREALSRMMREGRFSGDYRYGAPMGRTMDRPGRPGRSGYGERPGRMGR